MYVTKGFDRASGYKNLNQKYGEQPTVTDNQPDTRNSTETASTSNSKPENSFELLFLLIAIADSNYNPLWINPAPQSTRFYTPLRLTFEHETNDTTLKERKIASNNLFQSIDRDQ